MTIKQDTHNILPLIDEALSIQELAELKNLPLALHIKDIALLFYPGSKGKQQIFKIMMKSAIYKKELKALSINEFSCTTMEREQSRRPEKYKEPENSSTLPSFTMVAVAHQSNDVVNEDHLLVIHQDEMHRWLMRIGEWPLDKNNLLSLWWPDKDEKESKYQKQALKDKLYKKIDYYAKIGAAFCEAEEKKNGQLPTKLQVQCHIETKLLDNDDKLGKKIILPENKFEDIWKKIPDIYKRERGEKTKK